MAATEYYTMSDEKAAEIAAAISYATLTVAAVREFALADWAEGEVHQAWLDNATPAEIADWILASHE